MCVKRRVRFARQRWEFAYLGVAMILWLEVAGGNSKLGFCKDRRGVQSRDMGWMGPGRNGSRNGN